MKKILLSLAFGLITSMTTFAQTTWNFSDWPLVTNYPNSVVNNLGIYAGGDTITNFGNTDSSTQNFQEGFTGTQRFRFRGSSYTVANGFVVVPSQRYLYVKMKPGSASVKVWFKNGSTNAVHTLYVSDGTQKLGEATTRSGAFASVDYAILDTTFNLTEEKDIYIYADNAVNLYKIEINGNVGTTLSTKEVKANIAKVYTQGKTVHVALDSKFRKSDINVFNMNGSLVKTLKANNNTQFDLPSGIYIVNLKADNAIQSVKVLVK